MLVVALWLVAASDWSVFPEGKTTLRQEYSNKKRGKNNTHVYTIARKGQAVEVEYAGSKFRAVKLSAPATDDEGGTLLFECAKTTATVHSDILTFKPPKGEQCEGALETPRSKKPKKLPGLSCKVELNGEPRGDEPLVFVPKREIIEVQQDNDCTKAKALRLP